MYRHNFSLSASICQSKLFLRVSSKLFVLSMLAFPAWANVSEFRVTTAGDQFSGTVQAASVFHIEAAPSSRIQPNRIELGIGVFSNDTDTRPFVSLGPVWQLKGRNQQLYTELGFSPTFLGGSTFGDSDLGGNVHFTSSIAFGYDLNALRDAALTLRVQHISNGSLHRTNPGMDMVGLSFVNRF